MRPVNHTHLIQNWNWWNPSLFGGFVDLLFFFFSTVDPSPPSTMTSHIFSFPIKVSNSSIMNIISFFCCCCCWMWLVLVSFLHVLEWDMFGWCVWFGGWINGCSPHEKIIKRIVYMGDSVFMVSFILIHIWTLISTGNW